MNSYKVQLEVKLADQALELKTSKYLIQCAVSSVEPKSGTTFPGVMPGII
jgi:hypothetical protein